jgi:hypothetical protein
VNTRNECSFLAVDLEQLEVKCTASEVDVLVGRIVLVPYRSPFKGREIRRRKREREEMDVYSDECQGVFSTFGIDEQQFFVVARQIRPRWTRSNNDNNIRVIVFQVDEIHCFCRLLRE